MLKILLGLLRQHVLSTTTTNNFGVVDFGFVEDPKNTFRVEKVDLVFLLICLACRGPKNQLFELKKLILGPFLLGFGCRIKMSIF